MIRRWNELERQKAPDEFVEKRYHVTSENEWSILPANEELRTQGSQQMICDVRGKTKMQRMVANLWAWRCKRNGFNEFF